MAHPTGARAASVGAMGPRWRQAPPKRRVRRTIETHSAGQTTVWRGLSGDCTPCSPCRGEGEGIPSLWRSGHTT